MSQQASLLTVAGTDPSSGAGVGADLAVIRDWGYHGTSVVTAVIAQNTQGIRAFWPMAAQRVVAQLEHIRADIEPAGIKIGVLGSDATVEALAEHLDRCPTRGPLVLDPVLASGQDGSSLGGARVARAIVQTLLHRLTLITPNAPEAHLLTGVAVDDRTGQHNAGTKLVNMGATAALIKGGHLQDSPGDLLAYRNPEGHIETQWFPVEHVYPYAVRGTGCHLSTAICAALAQDRTLVAAVKQARVYLDRLWKHHAQTVGKGARVFVHGVGTAENPCA